MTNEQIVAELNKIMKCIESVDFMSHEKSVQNSNQLKVHKAYNMLNELKNNLN